MATCDCLEAICQMMNLVAASSCSDSKSSSLPPSSKQQVENQRLSQDNTTNSLIRVMHKSLKEFTAPATRALET